MCIVCIILDGREAFFSRGKDEEDVCTGVGGWCKALRCGDMGEGYLAKGPEWGVEREGMEVWDRGVGMEDTGTRLGLLGVGGWWDRDEGVLEMGLGKGVFGVYVDVLNHGEISAQKMPNNLDTIRLFFYQIQLTNIP